MKIKSVHDVTGYRVGWVRKRDTSAAGANTSAYLRAVRDVARRAGYVQVGTGRPENPAEVIYLPTCSAPGFRRNYEKLYFSRWEPTDVEFG